MEHWSPLTGIYRQYHQSLAESRRDYASRLERWGRLLNEKWEECIKQHIVSFAPKFRSADFRTTHLRHWAERFFGATEIPFVAIDGSSHLEAGDRFISVYGGAYGSKGTITMAGERGELVYHRWALTRDVSAVAFIPIPPEAGEVVVEEPVGADEHAPPFVVMSDRELASFTSLHNRVMQLAEIYLAYELARSSTVEAPRLLLLDNTLSGWLGNTSFGPGLLSLIGGKVSGYEVRQEDVYTVLAHPMNVDLGVPAALQFLPHCRLIAEAMWRDTTVIREEDLGSDFPSEVFRKGGQAIEKSRIGTFKQAESKIELFFDPAESWKRMVRMFEEFGEKMFRKKDPRALVYAGRKGKTYLTPRDLQFICGIGLRALIEECWKAHRRILLVGVVKDSHSCYFFRNYLGSLHVFQRSEPGIHTEIGLSDRTILELLAQVRDELEAPWATLEFDSCFMTIIPKPVNGGGWTVGGYEREGHEYTRPPRIFLRSLAQFLLNPQTRLASHVIFIDRLVYPGWDDTDSQDIVIQSPGLGRLHALRYSSPPRLGYLTMYLLTSLVRNHFFEALGYPEPLHKADWGAKSIKDNVKRLLKSAWLVDREEPLLRTFRRIRDAVGR
jgi:hypothetical protein